MPSSYRPSATEELCNVIAAAACDGSRLRISGGGSKDAIGAPTPAVPVLDMRGFSGVVDYDPPELVLTVRAGTPLAEVEAVLAAEGQMLAFEPWDHGRLLGGSPGAATIGGVVAAGVSGPQRLVWGGARDHLLGFEAVSGRGQAFKAGSKVVKNVTGFDLSKLIAGSWGRLVAVTSLTLKVMPRPDSRQTLVLLGLGPEEATGAMSRAMGSPAGVSAAAYLPQWHDGPATLFRLDGFRESVAARVETLRVVLGKTGRLEEPAGEESASLWHRIRDASLLPKAPPLWRIVIAPSKLPEFARSLDGAEWYADWAGGLVWAATDANAESLRAAANSAAGHATLVRSDAEVRARIPAFHPQAPGVATIETRIRRAFDPGQVFETGRF